MATQMQRPTMVNYSPARARWATVRIETEGGIYVGRVFVPETKKRLSDVLCDDRPFISLTEVSINDGETHEAFVALNKNFVKTVRVLDEGSPEQKMLRPVLQ